VENDLRRCEDGIVTDELIFCIDCGTSDIKTVLLDMTGTVHKMYSDEDFPYDKIMRMHDFNKCKVIVTGARTDTLDLEKADFEAIIFNEIECNSMLPKCLGIDRAVVASIGTGTPFIAAERGEGIHLGGSGVGGGTFIGLAERLLGISDPALVEQIAAGGNINNVNIMVGDIYRRNALDGLKSDYTASNFAKSATVTKSGGNFQGDIARGIHSLVGEVVGCMAGQLARYNGYDSVVFCGAVCENSIIRGILTDCLSIYGIEGVFIENSSFGTCFGAIMKYISA